MHKPTISIIVIAYNMAEQLQNTLSTLNHFYQRNISPSEFEIIVIENPSDNPLPVSFIESLPNNFRYVLRPIPAQSPASAINYGINLSRGEIIGLMIDGAHMLTPGVLFFARMAFKMSSDAFVSVPTYHLGPEEQHLSTSKGYGLEQQRLLLNNIDWKADGYQLFTVGTLCGANPRGYFGQIMESNCYFSSKKVFLEIGGADETYTLAGGGSLNLDLFRKLGTRSGSLFFTLAGEGSFHQYHGGVTSNLTRPEYEKDFAAELAEKWSGEFRFLDRNPIVLGQFSEPAHEKLLAATTNAKRRFQICRKMNWPVWADDE